MRHTCVGPIETHMCVRTYTHTHVHTHTPHTHTHIHTCTHTHIHTCTHTHTHIHTYTHTHIHTHIPTDRLHTCINAHSSSTLCIHTGHPQTNNCSHSSKMPRRGPHKYARLNHSRDRPCPLAQDLPHIRLCPKYEHTERHNTNRRGYYEYRRAPHRRQLCVKYRTAKCGEYVGGGRKRPEEAR